MTLDDYWLTVIVSVLLPLIVALVTKQVAPGVVKSFFLLALSAATGFFTSWQTAGDGFDWRNALVATAVSFTISVASHFGFWKPADITGSDGRIQTSLPGGVG